MFWYVQTKYGYYPLCSTENWPFEAASKKEITSREKFSIDIVDVPRGGRLTWPLGRGPRSPDSPGPRKWLIRPSLAWINKGAKWA